ncbi:hypothetical protein BT96DRAFT_1022437 [Gymnopus androsaceus JB14]|uniref:DNA polymerase delta, subunit 4 n=1 Tax=Gymnopus androsaceus JB14 TaxID=1447944 RepID=A0A6A4H8X1_9AGAR|nr:hypothetical protein BT96DRAFT_1022437 [Gymnopus androsaceus JB14]
MPKSSKQTTLNFGNSKTTFTCSSCEKIQIVQQECLEEASYSRKSDDEEDLVVPQKRKRAAGGTKSNAKEEEEEDEVEFVQSPAKERPELKIHDPRWRKLAVSARDTNGNLQLIHAKKENKIHDILRVFDLSYEYGPCYGISRIDRWERAEALGLNPPSEIRDILMTRQGIEDPKYAQCVFFDQAERI